MKRTLWLGLCWTLLAALPSAAASTALDYLGLSDKAYHSVTAWAKPTNGNLIDTTAGTIRFSLAYSDTLDLQSLSVKALLKDGSTPVLRDAQGDTLKGKNYLTLDAQGKAVITALAKDGTTQEYTITLVRRAASQVTALASFTLYDGVLSEHSALSKNTGVDFINSASDTGSISITLKYGEDYDLDAPHFNSATTPTGDTCVLLEANGDTLEFYKLIEMNSEQKALIKVIAEDGKTTQYYWFTLNKLPPSSVTALRSLLLTDGKGNQASAALEGGRDIDTAKASIHLSVNYTDKIDLSDLRIGEAWTTDTLQATLLNQNGDTLSEDSVLKFNAQGQASLTVQAENGSTRTYTLSTSRNPISTSTALYSIGFLDMQRNLVCAAIPGVDGGSCNFGTIDTASGLIEIDLPSGHPLDTHNLMLFTPPWTTGGVEALLVDAQKDTLSGYYPTPLDAQGKFSFTAYAEDRNYHKDYTLHLKWASGSSPGSSSSSTANSSSSGASSSSSSPAGPSSSSGASSSSSSSTGTSSSSSAEASSSSGSSSSVATESLSPVSPSLVLDWREALRSSHGEARLYGLNGRLLWSATLPQSLEAVESRRRAYTGPLMLRAGGTFYRLPPLPR